MDHEHICQAQKQAQTNKKTFAWSGLNEFE